MKLFECTVDDGKELFTVYLAAKSKQNLQLPAAYDKGETITKAKDVTNHYFNDETTERLESDLFHMRWGLPERALIVALVDEHIKKLKR